MTLKMLAFASIASVPLMALSAMAQTQTPSTAAPPAATAPVANTPDAHTTTTVQSENGKIAQTPPVGMRSGDKNTGGN